MKYHRFYQFFAEPTDMTQAFPAWFLKLLGGNVIEFNIKTQKWYMNRDAIIEDGDYIVQMHPDVMRVKAYADTKVDPGDAMTMNGISEMFKNVLGPVEFQDLHGYGVIRQADMEKFSSTMDQTEAAIAQIIDMLNRGEKP